MTRPKQRIPTKEKDDDWFKRCAKYYSSVCKPAVDWRRVDILYRAANGELDETDYLYVTNPYHTEREKYRRFPAKLRNYDIISTDVMLLMGEKRKRGLGFTVTATNSQIDDERKTLLNQEAEKYLTNQLIGEIVSMQQMNGVAIDAKVLQGIQQTSVQEIQKKADSLQDKIAKMGQSALNYIVEFNKFGSQCAENWYHFLVTGRAFSYRTVFKDEVVTEPVSPREIRFLAHSRIRDLEDAESIVRYVRMPFNEICDKFQNVKGFDEILPILEARAGYGGDVVVPYNIGSQMTDQDNLALRESSQLWTKLRGSSERVYSDALGFLVEHVVWESQIKIGKLKTTNIFGEPIEEEVDEDFTPQLGEEVEWTWVPIRYQCWVIDDKYVIGGGPVYETLSGRTDGYRRSKNPYNGKILNMRHVNPISLVEKGINYQIKYNIVHYYIEKCFAKNLDKIVVMPIGLIPENKNLDMEASMYYANAMGFLFVDDSSKQFQAALNGIKVLDASLSQHINRLYEYLKIIKDEWDASIGITPQRKGQMLSSDGKATTENSVFRSSIMTEEYFTQFEEMEEADLQYAMELSKIAFSEGKKAIFVVGDNHLREYLEIDPEGFCYSDYLVRVKRSGKELEKLEQARSMAQALTQNKDGRFSDVVRVIRADDISELLEEMIEVESAFDQQQQNASQAEQEHELRIEQMKQDQNDKTYNAAIYKADKTYDGVVEAARIAAEAKFLTKPGGEEGDNDIAKLEKIELEREKMQADKEKAQLDARTKLQMSKDDLEADRYKADKQLDAAKASYFDRRSPLKE